MHYQPQNWLRTFNISDEDRHNKEAKEAEATERLMKELPPYMAQLLERYEAQQEPEARFVRFVDKLLPAIINIMAGDATTFQQDYNVITIDELLKNREGSRLELLRKFLEFDVVHLVKDLIFDTSAQYVFSTSTYPNIFKNKYIPRLVKSEVCILSVSCKTILRLERFYHGVGHK